MKYRPYLKNTIQVSEIGLGAWQLGHNSGWKSMRKKEAIELVHEALDHGINFFDTAPNYGHGTGEERLGKGLQGQDRDKIVINTKFGRDSTGHVDFSSKFIRRSLEGSLRRLQVDYVDSIIIHNPPSEYFDGNKQDHYEILERLLEEGKIKAYGASIDTYDDIKLLLDTTNAKVLEVFFNILHQEPLRAFEMAKEKDATIIVKIPLDSGWLSGKYHAESRFDDIRSRWSEDDIRTRAMLVDKVRQIVGKDRNLPQMALAYCLAYDAVSTVIPGNLNSKQLLSNVQSSDIVIPEEMVKQFEALYRNEIEPLHLPW